MLLGVSVSGAAIHTWENGSPRTTTAVVLRTAGARWVVIKFATTTARQSPSVVSRQFDRILTPTLIPPETGVCVADRQLSYDDRYYLIAVFFLLKILDLVHQSSVV